jgi:hypothetical protein
MTARIVHVFFESDQFENIPIPPCLATAIFIVPRTRGASLSPRDLRVLRGYAPSHAFAYGDTPGRMSFVQSTRKAPIQVGVTPLESPPRVTLARSNARKPLDRGAATAQSVRSYQT